MSKTPRTRQLLMVAVIPATLVVLTIFAYSALAQGAGTGDQPRNLRIQSAEDGMILTWDAPAEDAASVTGYRIKRRAPDKGQRQLRVLVADTGSTETIYLDTTTKNGVRYVYRVHALRGEVVSAESNFAERRYRNPAKLLRPLRPRPVRLRLQQRRPPPTHLVLLQRIRLPLRLHLPQLPRLHLHPPLRRRPHKRQSLTTGMSPNSSHRLRRTRLKTNQKQRTRL